MSEEKTPSSGTFLTASLMYFCSGKPTHFYSGVDTKELGEAVTAAASRRTKRALDNIRHADCDEPSFGPVLSRSDYRAVARASFYTARRALLQRRAGGRADVAQRQRRLP